MVKKAFILFLILYWPDSAWAQVFFNKFTTVDGLAHDITYEIIQDQKGYIWIATENGLVKYDGKNFLTYNSLHGNVTENVIALLPIGKDSLALGSWGGGLQIINKLGQPLLKKPIAEVERIKTLKSIGNHLYGSMYFSIFQYVMNGNNNHRKVEFSLVDDNDGLKIKKIIGPSSDMDAYYRFNIATIDDELFYLFEPKRTILNTKSFKGVYSSSKEVNVDTKIKKRLEILSNNHVSFLTKFNDEIIAGTKDSLLFLKNNQFTKKIHLPINGSYVLKVLFFNRDEFVFTSVNELGTKFVYLFRNGQLTDLQYELRIKNSISDILIDHEKNIWITTYGDGVFQIPSNQNEYSYIDKSEFSNPNIVDISVGSNGEMILVSADYLYIYNEDKKFVKKIKLKYECREAELTDNIITLFCTKSSYEKDVNSIVQYAGYFTNYVKGIGFITTSNGSLLLNGKIIGNGFKTVQPNCVSGSNRSDCIWIVDQDSLKLYNYLTNQKVVSHDLTNNICGSKIYTLFVTGDSIWLATNQCLQLFYDGKLSRIKLLEDEYVKIFDIISDLDGRIWIASQKGLFFIDPGGIKRMRSTTGLSSDFVKSLCLDSKGKIWAGGSAGVTIIDPATINTKTYPRLDVEQNNCNFKINVISYNSSNALEAQYKLDGDSIWFSHNQGELSLCQLNAGEHTLFYRYRKIDSDWSKPMTFEFYINLPWYKQWWTLTALIAMLSAVIIFIISRRLRNIKKRNLTLANLIEERDTLEEQLANSRNDLAMDFHDDMGNKMSRIALLSELVVKEKKVNDETTVSRLEQINKDANVLYKSTKDFIWTLKKDSNQLDEIITYLSDFGEEFFASLNIEFDIENDCYQGINLPIHSNRHIIMICKEVMTNIAYHSKCSSVFLSFSYQNHVLEIQIGDNGIGIEEHNLNSQRGLRNLQERAKKINGKVQILRLEKGTLVKLIMELPITSDSGKN